MSFKSNTQEYSISIPRRNKAQFSHFVKTETWMECHPGIDWSENRGQFEYKERQVGNRNKDPVIPQYQGPRQQVACPHGEAQGRVALAVGMGEG